MAKTMNFRTGKLVSLSGKYGAKKKVAKKRTTKRRTTKRAPAARSRRLKRGPRRGIRPGEIAIFDDTGMLVMGGGSGRSIGRRMSLAEADRRADAAYLRRKRKKVGRRGVTAAEKRMLAAYAKSSKTRKRRTKRGGRATAAQLRALAYGRAVRAAKLGGRKRPAKPSAVGARARKGSYRAPANTQMISGDVKSAILELARRAKSAKKNMPGPVKTGLESLAKKVKQYHGRYC